MFWLHMGSDVLSIDILRLPEWGRLVICFAVLDVFTEITDLCSAFSVTSTSWFSVRSMTLSSLTCDVVWVYLAFIG